MAISFAILIEGLRREKNDAANIIPADKESKESIIFLFTFLKKTTIADPKDVILQQKNPAISAKYIGFILYKNNNIYITIISYVKLKKWLKIVDNDRNNIVKKLN